MKTESCKYTISELSELIEQTFGEKYSYKKLYNYFRHSSLVFLKRSERMEQNKLKESKTEIGLIVYSEKNGTCKIRKVLNNSYVIEPKVGEYIGYLTVERKNDLLIV
ncbi:MAG: hypothetical protein LBM95_08440 [Lactobacillales bacterium]|nr:hypothetical protein [Lactobacillales bacterium]